jgi:hypothetical protein
MCFLFIPSSFLTTVYSLKGAIFRTCYILFLAQCQIMCILLIPEKGPEVVCFLILVHFVAKVVCFLILVLN